MENLVQILRDGGVVVFPTDTVWGVGASIESVEGIEKFYQVKKREAEKPSQVLVADREMAQKYGVIEGVAAELAEKWWPGGLTLVVPAREKVPESVRQGRETVGLRVPDHKDCRQLIEKLGSGLVASSANFTGGVAPKVYGEIDPKLLEIVDGVMEGLAGGRTSSSVVAVGENGEMQVLREGDVKIG